jgi:NAD(P)-dependent dehydrogenase (short-subunit alcohol dehydrogenase family)
MSVTLDSLFNLRGKTAAITGGGGVLCGDMARALGDLGVKVAVLDLIPKAAKVVSDQIKAAGGKAIPVECNVLKRDSVEAAYKAVIAEFGGVDILINGAGGNKKEATTSAELSFFDLPDDAMRFVFDLNFIGTLIPCQVFGKHMAQTRTGCIINTSSMNSFRPLTKVVGYSAAKAAVSNFTAWLAVHMSQNYSPEIRVNAVAPGFFLTEQNRYLLTDQKTGKLTDRGQTVITHTPMDRFGDPKDLISTVVWLLGPGSTFVHGIVVPVDGGFSAFSGV